MSAAARRHRIAATLAVVIALLGGCGRDIPTGPSGAAPKVPPIPSSRVTIYLGPVYVGTFTDANARLDNSVGEFLDDDAAWTSSDTNVLAVHPHAHTATLIGRSVGTVKLEARIRGYTGSVNIAVTQWNPDGLEISATDAWLGDTVYRQAIAYRQIGKGKEYLPVVATWTIGDPTKADGLSSESDPWTFRFVAVDTGATTITATAFGLTATAQATFSQPTTTMQRLPDLWPTSLNDSGVIVGQRISDRHGVVYRAGTMTDLGSIPGYGQCYPSAINSAGHVVGACWSTATSSFRAFIWKSGAMAPLASLEGDESSYALAINDSDVVVGYSGSRVGGRALEWRDATPIALTALSLDWSAARAINAKGDIAGWSANADRAIAVVWSGSKVETFSEFTSAVGVSGSGDILFGLGDRGTLKRGSVVTELDFDAEGITESGVVYGGLDYGRPLIWRAGTQTDLGTIPKSATGAVLAANNRGQAVGAVNGVGAIWTFARTP